MQSNMILHKLATLTHNQTAMVSLISDTDSAWPIQGRTEWGSGHAAEWDKWEKEIFEWSTSL